jgi:hypothetical protein
MMVCARLGIGVNEHRAGPQFFGSHPGEIDRGRTQHAGRLGGIGVELIALDDFDAVGPPITLFKGLHGGSPTGR